MNCFVHRRFSNFVGPRPESARELIIHISLAETHDAFENVDENALCHDDRKDVCDVTVKNILKNVSVTLKECEKTTAWTSIDQSQLRRLENASKRSVNETKLNSLRK